MAPKSEPVTGTLQTGAYIITNVASGNYATLTDANKGTELKASDDDQSEDVYWNITKLSNNKYTIKAYIHATYAKVSYSPSDSDPVEGRSDEYQWNVKETGKKGQYIIRPHSDDMLYWCLVNSNRNTSVKLSGNDDFGDSYKIIWQFTRVTLTGAPEDEEDEEDEEEENGEEDGEEDGEEEEEEDSE